MKVMVVTTHEGVPQEFYGAKLIGSRRLLQQPILTCTLPAAYRLSYPYMLTILAGLVVFRVQLHDLGTGVSFQLDQKH